MWVKIRLEITPMAPIADDFLTIDIAFNEAVDPNSVADKDLFETPSQGRNPKELRFRMAKANVPEGVTTQQDLMVKFPFDANRDACVVDVYCYPTEVTVTYPHSSTPAGLFAPDTHPFHHEANVVYKCGTAMAFFESGTQLTVPFEFTCEWGAWTPAPPATHADWPECKWTHCPKPVDAPAAAMVGALDWTGALINFDASVPYYCLKGHKFEADFAKVSEDVFCRAENNWDEPNPWPVCVPSTQLTYNPFINSKSVL